MMWWSFPSASYEQVNSFSCSVWILEALSYIKCVLDNFQSTSVIQEVKHFTYSHLTLNEEDDLVARLVYIMFQYNHKSTRGTERRGLWCDGRRTRQSSESWNKKTKKSIKCQSVVSFVAKLSTAAFLPTAAFERILQLRHIIKVTSFPHRNVADDFKDLVDSLGANTFLM